MRSEDPGIYRQVREQTRIPLAVGEPYGDRWDSNERIENHLIDNDRVTIPYAGGITEHVKLPAVCETHYVGLIPHNGPISELALVHVCGSSGGPALKEMRRGGWKQFPWSPQDHDLRDGIAVGKRSARAGRRVRSKLGDAYRGGNR